MHVVLDATFSIASGGWTSVRKLIQVFDFSYIHQQKIWLKIFGEKNRGPPILSPQKRLIQKNDPTTPQLTKNPVLLLRFKNVC